MKTCTKCGAEKPLDAFNRERRRPDGRRAYCKACAPKNTSNRLREAHDAAGFYPYMRAHGRVRVARGPAKNYPCAHPECDQQAGQWALDLSFPAIVRSKGSAYGPPYLWANDVAAYRPLCRSHNYMEDAERRRRETAMA